MALSGDIPDIRRSKLLDLIKEKKVLSVSEIIDLFDSSQATISRDLKLLEKKRKRGVAPTLKDRRPDLYTL